MPITSKGAPFKEQVRVPGKSLRIDEHVCNQVFKSIEMYDGRTKLGLKVFHLQRLSLTAFNDAAMSQSSSYRKLKSGLFDRSNMSQLSNAQLVAMCVGLGKLKSADTIEWSLLGDALKGSCKSSVHPLSSAQVSACLYSFAKSGNAYLLKDGVVDTLFKHTLKFSSDWSPVDMGWVLYFMRSCTRAGARPRLLHRMLDQIAYRFNERLARCSVKNIACILHELSVLRLLPGHAIYRACHRLEVEKKKIDPKTMMLLFLSLARLRVYKLDLLYSLSNHVISNLDAYSPRQRTSILYALAKLGVRNSTLVEALISQCESDLPELSEIDFALLAYSLGSLNIQNRAMLWKAMFDRFRGSIDMLSPQTIAMFVSALGKARFPVVTGHLSSIYVTLEANKAGFTDRQLLNSLNALASLGGLMQKSPSRDFSNIQLSPNKVVKTQWGRIVAAQGGSD